jgi:hypothetical protein
MHEVSAWIKPMGDFPAMTSTAGSTAGSRKVLGVDAGDTFEEVGRMVIKPSAARQGSSGSSHWESEATYF